MLKGDAKDMHLWYTLGPATLGIEKQAISSGATGARLTFSYGTKELQFERAKKLRLVAQGVNKSTLIIADLEGEKFRLGSFQQEDTYSCTAGTMYLMNYYLHRLLEVTG